MKNVTITLDEQTAAWARVRAAEQGMSLSRLVGKMLRETMTRDRDYEEAMRRFLSKKPKALGPPGQPLPRRDELYDRGNFR